MAIYHKWKTVFIQIPKNASNSIHDRLRNRTDDNLSYGSYFDVMQQNDPDLFDSYYSFSCVRNPYDRFVSAYEDEHLRTNSLPFGLEFDAFVKKIYNDGQNFYLNYGINFMPQFKFISIKNIILVDKVIKFENLNDEWREVAEIINKKVDFKIYNKLNALNVNSLKINKNWVDYYNEKTKDMIYELYKKDFDLFGYEK